MNRVNFKVYASNRIPKLLTSSPRFPGSRSTRSILGVAAPVADKLDEDATPASASLVTVAAAVRLAPYLRPSIRRRSAFRQSPLKIAARKPTIDGCSRVTPDSDSSDLALDL